MNGFRKLKQLCILLSFAMVLEMVAPLGTVNAMAAQMDILLEQAGYQCRVVHATHGSGDHYWNQIYINGTWTNYDVTNWWSNYTWDQMVAAGDYILLGYVRPEYK